LSLGSSFRDYKTNKDGKTKADVISRRVSEG
jgi:hypothetical protein